MKIAVLNCPGGVSAKALIGAFQDAGLPQSYLKKELTKRRPDPKTKALTVRILKALEREKNYISNPHILMQVAQVAAGIRYFQIEKCFLRNLTIGRKGNPRILKLLKGFNFERSPVKKEWVTAEGAAILSVLCEKEISIPAMRLVRVGFGSGSLQMSIGETLAPYRRERILLLETNIDDMNPQGFELLYERLFQAGALDVWVEPILMKKMRPAFKLSILFNHPDQEKISEAVFKETPTLGVRFFEMDRFSLPRKIERVKTRFGPVRAKIGWLDSKHSVISPEYEDLKRISKKARLPFSQVYQICKKAAEQTST